MIKAIIFDFDGVIVESRDIKTEAFRQLFADYPDKVDQIINYHLTNMGISRYVKFRYFYEQILGQKLSTNKEAELGERFSKLVLDEVLNASLVPGADTFLRENYGYFQFFIASGTPEEELRHIVTYRGLDSYFKGIYGAPRKKSEIIEYVLVKYDLSRGKVVFVGDADSDRVAAEQTGVHFVFRVGEGNKSHDSTLEIRDLTELNKILDKL